MITYMRNLLIIALVILTCSTAIVGGDFVNGATTCASSGNKQVSSTSYYLHQLTVTAGTTTSNTGNIAIGGTSVTTANAPLLGPGWTANWTSPSANLNPATLYFSCTVNTDTIQWIGAR